MSVGTSSPNRSPHLVLLHGALGSLEAFDSLASILNEHRLVFSLNFSGHGGTPFEGPFRIERFAEEVLDMMNRVELEKVDLFGFSMGGYVALYVALMYPERVRKVITLGTKFHWTPEIAAAELRMLDVATIQAKVPKFAEALRKRHHPEDWTEVISYTAEMMTALGNDAPLTAERLNQIAHPALLLRGEKDRMISLEETQWAANNLQHAHYVPLPACPHPIEQVDPQQLAPHILAFLSDA